MTAIRPCPYPYRAMLAICSDLDRTPSREVYEDTARFLNTTEPVGAMGEGVGLEVGNSLYFDMPSQQFAYWNTDDSGREMLRTLIRSGHVDCFHSYGDLALTRAHAARALDELARHGCGLGVWIDHAVAPTNLGADIMAGSGDLPQHPAYHADLTVAAGVRYVWRGRVTSVIGQDAPRGYAGLFDRDHAIGSSRTIAKEWAKGVVARCGVAKYAMHASNELLRPARLRDGNRVWEFLRFNPFWKSVTLGDKAEGLGHVVTSRMLDALCARGGSSILYTHLGKIKNPEEPLPAHSRESLRLVARYQAAGAVLVTTTRRILDHARARRETAVSVSVLGDHATVRIDPPSELCEAPVGDPRCGLSGLTIYVPAASHATVLVAGRPVTGYVLNPADETGRPSVSLPFPRLSFPDVSAGRALHATR